MNDEGLTYSQDCTNSITVRDANRKELFSITASEGSEFQSEVLATIEEMLSRAEIQEAE